MSDRNLTNWLESFMDLTEDSEPPVLFRKWTGLSAIASALQRKVRLELGISLTFYPNLYIVLVGPSATGKGTAMKYASDIIEQIPNIRLSAQATSLQALIRRMKDTNLTDIDFATGEQLYHSSLTIFSTEFTVFLGYHNRELMAALCEWYDCHNRWTYETISRDKEEIVGVWVNLLGGTTPDSIQSSLPIESIGGGLTSRIIFVVEEKKNKLVVFPGMPAKMVELQEHLILDLEQIAKLSGEFKYEQAVMDIYSDWCHFADENPPFQDRKFDGYCGRRRKHLMSLAMICNASRTDSMYIEARDIKEATELLTEVELNMGMVFKGMGKSDISSLIQEAIVYLENTYAEEIPLQQFARRFEGDLDQFTLDRVLFTLESMGYIKQVRRPGLGVAINILDKGGKDNEGKRI